MSPAAFIEHLTLALHTSSPAVGKALGGRMHQLFHSELLRVITEEFELAEQAHPTAGCLRLPQLVLDLEPMLPSRLEQDLPARLRTALRQALAALPRPAISEPPGQANLLASLTHFLLFGQVPWQAAATGFEPEQAVAQALRTHRGALCDLLRRVGQQAGPRQRLVRQLSAAALGQLIQLLEPVHAVSVAAYVQGMLALHGRRALVPASAQAWHHAVLEEVVASLARARHTLFNETSFVEQQLRQLAMYYHVDYQYLLHELAYAAAGNPRGAWPAVAPAFTRLIRALARPDNRPGQTSFPMPGFAGEFADFSGRLAQPTSGLPTLATRATGRLLGPLPTRFHPAGQVRLAPPATPPEAREEVLAYLLHGRSHPARVGWLRGQLRRATHQHPAAVAEFVRRYRAVPGLLARLALVADFAILEQLRPGTRAAARPGLAALDALAASPGEGARLAAFLKALFVAFHYATGRLSPATTRQLAAAHGLPWETTRTQLAQLRSDYPTLGAAPFFRRFWESLPTAPPATRPPALTKARAAHQGPDSPATAAALHSLPAESEQTRLARLFRYLLHGPAAGAGPPGAGLRHTFGLVARQPSPLREFLRQHARNRAVQQHLAHLADFSALHTLVASPGPGRRQRQAVRLALAALDRRLHQATRPGPTRFGLFLRQAYSAFALMALGGTAPSTGVVDAIRQRTLAAGLSWRGVLTRVSWLLRQLPVLAADPFFEALLQASLGQTIRRRPRARRPAAAPPHAPAASLPAEASWTTLAQHLDSGPWQPPELLTQAVAELLRPGNGSLLERLHPYLARPTARTYLATVLTGEQFRRLLQALFPQTARPLAALLHDWRRLHRQRLVHTSPDSALLWAEVLAVAATPGLPATRATALAQRLLRLEQAHYRPGQRPALRRLVQAITQRRVALSSPLGALLAAQLAAAPTRQPAARRPDSSRPTLPKPLLKPEAPPLAGTVYIANAGLVLLNPYFTLLFERAGYVQDRAFKDPEAAERAAHLLHFLVSGEENPPEHLLVLNKLLCGIEPAQPLARLMPLTAEEKATGEGLLGAAIGRWEALKNTSIAGLREFFLQRPGKLVWSPDKVTLTVEAKTVDILLDRLPWSIALLKLPWMALPLYVTWR